MPPKILCIDDDGAGLSLRKLVLEAEGYFVVTATNGAEGLALLAKGDVSAIILDYRMPDMDGGEVAVAIKKTWPQVPIVMLSGFTEDIPDCVQGIVNALVTKGGEPQQLMLVVHNLLARRASIRATILCVDDNPAQRYSLARALRDAGFTVVEAANGREAIELASSKPNLILLDVNLPDMLGFQVCKELKANPQTKDIPIIQISATYDADLVESEALSCGAARFVEHTHDPLRILQAVHRELGRGVSGNSGAPV